jgi:transposase-like protein
MGRPSKYPPEFRVEAVELVKTSGRPRVQVARSLGISDNTLRNWVQADREARANAELRLDRRSSAKRQRVSPERRHGEPLPCRR